MRPASAAFLAAIAAGHTAAIRVTLLTSGTETALAAVVDGSVTLDATAASRGRLDLTFVDDGTLGLVPASATSSLAPYGNELRIERGITFADGTQEFVSLGVFRIDDCEVADHPDGLEVRVSGIDRSARIIDAQFEAPYQVASGTLFTDAILTVVQVAYPDVSYSFASSSLTTPFMLAVEEGADRWAFAQNLAMALGMELYFDGDGVLTLRVGGSSSAVATIAEGTGGVLVDAGRQFTRQDVFNRLIVTGENSGTGTPPRATATDDNPLSPTYYYGPFGKVPHFESLSFVTTNAQASDVAQALLTRQLGASQSVNFGAIVNPALEPGDVVRITRLRSKIDEDHYLDAVTIPLDVGSPMSGQTRATPLS